MVCVKKTITIREDQDKWLKKIKLNLSFYTQGMIDELMIRFKKKK